MTNYLDKEGLKKFWDITKGKYSALGHNHDDRYLKIGATAANADKLGGYASSSYVKTIYIGTKQDYQDTVILLWKDGVIGYYHMFFAQGSIYTMNGGAGRHQCADMDLWSTRWGEGNLQDIYFLFNTLGQGVRMKIVTCTYEGETWWAIQHTNIQSVTFYFTGRSTNISWTPIAYYNQVTKQVLNQEIYDSIVDQSSKLSTYYVGDARNALTTDIPAKLSQLTDDVVKGKYLPLSGGTVSGNLTANSTLTVGGAATLNSSLTVKGTTSVQDLTVNGVLTTKGNGLELYHATPFIDFHYDNSASDYNVRIWNNVSGGLQINAPTLIDLVGPMKSSGGRLWITNGNTNIYDVTTSMLMSYVPVEHLSTSQLVGNVGIGTAPDAAYKLRVLGMAYFDGDATFKNIKFSGTLDQGNFGVDSDGVTYAPEVHISNDGGLVISDSEGTDYIFDVEKAKELGLLV